MDILERIKSVVKWLIGNGLADNQEGIGRLLGYSNKSSFSQILNGQAKLPGLFVDKIVALDKRLNKVWIETGKGEMLVQFLGNSNIEQTDDMYMEGYATKDDSNMFDAIIKTGKRGGYRLVPQYNMDARGGFGDNDEIDTKEYVVDYVPFKDAKESDICIPVSGNSMSPVYAPGTIILLHRVETWREFIELGQVYVIILTDGRRLLKELKRGAEKDSFLCVSYNPSFEPVELSKDLISDVYLVTAIYQKTTI
jgi:phage repressor protein C with HTH and peptisase S24 domain